MAYGADSLQFGELRLPRGEGPFPVAVVVHGGCWVSQLGGMDPRAVALDNMRPVAAALAEEGIATWNIEYRRLGNGGGGWPGTFRDVAAGADYLHELSISHPLDLSRVITIGHSAGGHLAMWLALRPRLPDTSDLYTADPLEVAGVISIDGPTDMQSMHPIESRICGAPVITDLMGGSPEEQPARYRDTSPVAMLPLGIPQEIFAGRMFAEQAEAYEQDARAAGDRVQATVEPDAGHFVFIDPESGSWPSVVAAARRLLPDRAGAADRTAQQLVRPQESALEVADFEDYRNATGRSKGGRLHVELETREAGWRPWGDEGPLLRGHTFAEPGRRARVPGPMIRVTSGTPVHVTLRNTLPDTLLVRGLRDRGQETPPGAPPFPAAVPLAFIGDSVEVGPGARGEVRFTPTVPGTYYYYGLTVRGDREARPEPPFEAQGPDNTLIGVLIVDPPGTVPDDEERIFLISQWADPDVPESWQPTARFLINGRSWPHTERLVYQEGDKVRWRVINQSAAFHPMHLHGFYFRVEDWLLQTGTRFLQVADPPMAVTWPMPATSAMRISWVAAEPGNWLFHCHLMRHMSRAQAAPAASHSDHPQDATGLDAMAGLVMGITVRPGPGHEPPPEVARRRLALHITRRDGVFDHEPAYGFVLEEGDPPPADSVRFPGSPLVLTRGEPTEIVVHNRADVPLGVHWHGLEVESWVDGVPGWSGTPAAPVPAIPPADSLVVRMTLPRAGTFMYHVHSEPGHQLAQGLYGAFLVMDPGEMWDPDRDRIFVLGALGAGEDPPPALNGRTEPAPLEFRAGETYRLRFMHISPDNDKSLALLDGDEPVEWRPIARDGADLPASSIRPTPAALRFFDVGTTLDFLWEPREPGELTLRVTTYFEPGVPGFRRDAPATHTMDVPVRVR